MFISLLIHLDQRPSANVLWTTFFDSKRENLAKSISTSVLMATVRAMFDQMSLNVTAFLEVPCAPLVHILLIVIASLD